MISLIKECLKPGLRVPRHDFVKLSLRLENDEGYMPNLIVTMLELDLRWLSYSRPYICLSFLEAMTTVIRSLCGLLEVFTVLLLISDAELFACLPRAWVVPWISFLLFPD